MVTQPKTESRHYEGRLERRAAHGDDEESRVLEGHAAVFDELSVDLWGFREKIDPGAFAQSIKDDDIRALFNHNPGMVLGRNKAGTLRLNEDRDGLAVEIDVPDTQPGNDLLESVGRGDIDQMSFSFNVQEERWEVGAEGQPDIRTLMRVQLVDVSPVTFPAYPATDISVAERSRAEWRSAGDRIESLKLRQRRLDIDDDGAATA